MTGNHRDYRDSVWASVPMDQIYSSTNRKINNYLSNMCQAKQAKIASSKRFELSLKFKTINEHIVGSIGWLIAGPCFKLNKHNSK